MLTNGLAFAVSNYVPSYSTNAVQTWADYDPVVIEKELDY